MAVYFISNDGMHISHHTGLRLDIQVGIVHEPRDGYLLSFDKEVIKEQLPLKEFITRLVYTEGRHREIGADVNSAIERDIHIVVTEINKSSEKVIAVCRWLDERYARLIRNKELVLAQHKYSLNVGHIERETISNTERSIRQSQPLTLEQAWNAGKVLKEMDRRGLKIDEGVTDEEVYYIMTK